MSREMVIAFVVLSLVWTVAVIVKASGALKSGEEYEFKMWDGGLMMRGKRTGKGGTIFMLVFAVVVLLLDFGLLGQL